MNTPKQSDLIELESLYISAKLSFKENENIDRSVYRQDDIEVLFKYILSSPWCNRNYDPREAFNLKSRVESATLPDIQSLLTYFARCEHFCDGAWANIIKKDELASCIERAKELVR